MAHLWVKDGEGQWAVLKLETQAYRLSTCVPQPVAAPPALEALASDVLLMNSGGKNAESWVLVAGADREVRVNGLRLATGVRVVVERDEIQVGGAGPVFFSAERLAAVEDFPGTEKPAHCPRCKQIIEPGTKSVRCPGCGVWYHQTEELPCWTYSPTCALCPQETDLSAGFRWTPEEL